MVSNYIDVIDRSVCISYVRMLTPYYSYITHPIYIALKCVDRLIHTHLLDLLDREMEFLSSINENDVHKKAKLHQFFGEHESYPTLMDTVKTLQSAEKVARDYRSTNTQSKSNHRRTQSDIPIQADYNQALSIDDPVEDEYNSLGWYCGKRSPSPPPLQSAGDISPPPPPTHRRVSTGGIVFPPDFQQSPYSPTKQSRSNKYSPSKSDKDSSLFRLMMTLQLCLVRIEEANSVLCNGKARASVRCVGGRPRSISFQSEEIPRFSPRRTVSNDGITVSLSDDSETSTALQPSSDIERDSSWRKSKLLILASIALGGSYFLTTKSSKETTNQEQYKLVAIASKAAVGVTTASFIRKRWRILTMNARVADSAEAIETWIFGWICLVNNNKEPRKNDIGIGHKKLLAPRKSLLWYSNGSIRFQLIKRGMDLLYASIGKAIEITRGQEAATKSTSSADEESSGLWTYVVASLAASYYNVVGPSAKSASSVANYSSSVLTNAWGVVSLPAVKKASLEAVRILKGAAIADRIEICGVSCFVLSRESCPALASALRRYRRQQKREDVRLGTIHESMLSTHSSTANVSSFQKQNVILHLTGGGFFAHTIAGDLPYLLDWSAACKSVIIIPEYALLPQTFPDAITEVTNIYQSLRSGSSATLLGFAPENIVVSGESVGGNLASALCVSLITNHEEGGLSSYEIVNDLEEGDGGIPSSEYESSRFRLDLPDALLLCCPFLNMSLDSTPSRVDGASDPVLPTALISTISRSYCKTSVEDPLASPYFASDDILRNFPQTLIFTSSEDPLLDDSVAFNGRLRSVGVKSKLRAVPDMPHAYWGLSTAGVPESRQVLKECQQWLAKVFNVD